MAFFVESVSRLVGDLPGRCQSQPIGLYLSQLCHKETEGEFALMTKRTRAIRAEIEDNA
jgi:hypothetical protein